MRKYIGRMGFPPERMNHSSAIEFDHLLITIRRIGEIVARIQIQPNIQNVMGYAQYSAIIGWGTWWVGLDIPN